jgi:translocation protein SEC62
MLRHKFFHRAKKVPVSEQELKAKLKKKDKERKHDGAEEKSKKEEDKGDADAESSHAEGEKKEDKSAVQCVSYFCGQIEMFVWTDRDVSVDR